ncbi:MAG: glucose-6-phosphate dehydrogenase [Bacteroidales bacterium]|nr:glucose-6-phosphate dehydrogenase [Bacteroidales bacterium]
MAPSCVVIIFGAGGDLTKRKLIPALFNLAKEEMIPSNFAMVGIDRVDTDSKGYRQTISSEIKEYDAEGFDQDLWDKYVNKAYYMKGDFKSADTYTQLKTLLAKVDKEQGTPGNYLFYLATPPSFFGIIAESLGKAGLTTETDDIWKRIIIEKPFGRDLATAQALNKSLHSSFTENQIYRIDHYLGKETVQNMMVYRFGNGTIEPIWNNKYIEHIQITVAESLGVEDRASYYEEAGALRDMMSNHLMAVLSIVAMEVPNSFDAEAIRDEQVKVLKSLRLFDDESVKNNVVRGQYGEGISDERKVMNAYREEPGVAKDSNIETFVAMKLMIDTWRWAGVPVYMRTGKRMPKRYSEVVIQYKNAPNISFAKDSDRRKDFKPNQLVIRIQPEEGISLHFNAKIPGIGFNAESVKMDFDYNDYFHENSTSSGYETLIYDCLTGDATLFKSAENYEVCWALLQPVLDAWEAEKPTDFPNYAANSFGPKEADELLSRDGHSWKNTE